MDEFSDDHCDSCGSHYNCWLAWLNAEAEDVEVTTNLFDEEELHPNCTVQILRNSVTGDVSVGWWENHPREADDGGATD